MISLLLVFANDLSRTEPLKFYRIHSNSRQERRTKFLGYMAHWFYVFHLQTLDFIVYVHFFSFAVIEELSFLVEMTLSPKCRALLAGRHEVCPASLPLTFNWECAVLLRLWVLEFIYLFVCVQMVILWNSTTLIEVEYFGHHLTVLPCDWQLKQVALHLNERNAFSWLSRPTTLFVGQSDLIFCIIFSFEIL